MPPIVAASSREAPSSTAAIANSRRACAASFFRSLGKTANLADGVVRPHRNGLAHGKPPQFAILNHAAIDSEIPRESATQRLGITFLRGCRCPGCVPLRFWRRLHNSIQCVLLSPTVLADVSSAYR